MTTSVSVVSLDDVTHPILTNRYIAWNQDIENASVFVRRRIELNHAGCSVFGPPGSGLSHSIPLIKLRIQQLGCTPIASHTICWRRMAMKRPHDFVRFIRSSIGIRQNHVGGADPIASLVYPLLETVGQQSAQSLVIFIAKADLMTEFHVEWLGDLRAALSSQRVNSTFVFIGNTGLKFMGAQLNSNGHADLAATFFVHQHEAENIRDLASLTMILETYDEHLRYPENSDCSYTQHFNAKAFAAGWRLCFEATRIWSALTEVHRSAGLPGDPWLTMSEVVSLVRAALTGFKDSVEPGRGIPPMEWSKLFKEISYVQAQKYRNNAGSSDTGSNQTV